MRSLIFLPLMGLSLSAAANMADYEKASKQFACINQVNMATMDMGFGTEPDGAAFAIGADGKTNVLDSGKIVSRETKDGVETIVYKAKVMTGFKDGKPVFETDRKTVAIRRDDQGRVVAVNKDMNLKTQIQNRDAYLKTEWGKHAKGHYPLIKGTESTFTYDGDSCDVAQSVYMQMQDENSKVESKVTYDKVFCDRMKPMISKMGSQNAAQCGNLIGMAQGAFDQRNAELAKEGKSMAASAFGMYADPYGGAPSSNAKTKQAAQSSAFNIGGAIAMCASMADGGMGMMGGYYGMGMGGIMGASSGGMMGGTGGIVGTGGIGGSVPAKAKTNQKDAKGTK
ncbi:hypothetical protein [Bdellovibrio bacteriovorus]|uniref:hypothetical protein n=1 Tax=Bdellovibrio bacteriovorus TaxID=959 RepID=UPI003AA86E34